MSSLESYSLSFNNEEIVVKEFHNWKNGTTYYCDQKDISLLVIEDESEKYFGICAIQFKNNIFYTEFISGDQYVPRSFYTADDIFDNVYQLKIVYNGIKILLSFLPNVLIEIILNYMFIDNDNTGTLLHLHYKVEDDRYIDKVLSFFEIRDNVCSNI
jgi:hypothetical protein